MEEKEIKIEIKPEIAKGTYSNLAIIISHALWDCAVFIWFPIM